MPKESQPPTPPSNEPILREVKPASRSKRPPLFQDFLSNFKGGTALEQALAEQAHRELATETLTEPVYIEQSQTHADVSLPSDIEIDTHDDQATGQPVAQSSGNSVNQATSNTKNQPTRKSKHIETDKPVDQRTGRPSDQPTNLPDHQPIRPSDDQPTTPINQTTGILVNQTTKTADLTKPPVEVAPNIAHGERTNLPINQATGRPEDQSASRPDTPIKEVQGVKERTSNQVTGRTRDWSTSPPVPTANPATEASPDLAAVIQPAARPRQGSLRGTLTRGEASEQASEASKARQTPENTYPSRVGKVKIGIWLPEQHVEMMKLWCLMHKTPMQDIIQQAVADWWDRQPVELALPVENVLKTMPTASQSLEKKSSEE